MPPVPTEPLGSAFKLLAVRVIDSQWQIVTDNSVHSCLVGWNVIVGRTSAWSDLAWYPARRVPCIQSDCAGCANAWARWRRAAQLHCAHVQPHRRPRAGGALIPRK
jgi:hypothetical protein